MKRSFLKGHMFDQSFLVLTITVFQIGLAKKLPSCGYNCCDFSKTWFNAQHSEVYEISWCRAGKVWEICKLRGCEAFFNAKIHWMGIVDSPSESPRETADFFFSIWVNFYSFRAHMYMATVIMICCSCMLCFKQKVDVLVARDPKNAECNVPWCLKALKHQGTVAYMSVDKISSI